MCQECEKCGEIISQDELIYIDGKTAICIECNTEYTNSRDADPSICEFTGYVGFTVFNL